uniref:NADH-ubiquinone oxidoreductase chain 2 n=1 Tax=Anodonta anatina TaxID=143294 RepID=A0A023I1R0_ANOAN|nr:NADH dehydrogenase subunit 2 [Anodonta anatina]AGS17937.1 NADH dehydrogenase subunit 2 [Anodonta anatina]
MFIILVVMTTLFAIITTNSMFSWMMMELNMLAFTPLIWLQKSTTEIDISIKYLIPQSFASSLFMMAIIMTTYSPYSNALASTSLLMKLGSAPFHAWFPAVMYSINIMAGFILMTWQKIIPLSLMMIPQMSFMPLILTSAMMTALWGSIAGLNQTSITSMLTFSSIAHLAWLTSASIFSAKVTFLYFMLYTFTLFPIFSLMNIWSMTSHKMLMHSSLNTYPQITFIISLLSLAGMPPLAMFSSKIPIIILMSTAPTTLIIMLIGAAISLYFYLIIIFTMVLNLSNSLNTSSKTLLSKNICALFITFQLSSLPLTLYLLPQ